MPVLQEFLGQSSAVGHNTRGQSSMLRGFKQFTQVWAECWLASNKGNLGGASVCQHLWNQERLFLQQLVTLVQVVKVGEAECTGVIAPRPEMPVDAQRYSLKGGVGGCPHGLEHLLRTNLWHMTRIF